jgi:hypothetical protein
MAMALVVARGAIDPAMSTLAREMHEYRNRGMELASLEGFEPPTRCLEGSRSFL